MKRWRLGAVALSIAALCVGFAAPAGAAGGATIQLSESGVVTHSVCDDSVPFTITLAGLPTDLASVNVVFWDTSAQPAIRFGTFAVGLTNGTGSQDFLVSGPTDTKFHVDFHASRTVHGTVKAIMVDC